MLTHSFTDQTCTDQKPMQGKWYTCHKHNSNPEHNVRMLIIDNINVVVNYQTKEKNKHFK